MTCTFALPTELTIYTAAETRAAWLAALSAPAEGPLRVDAAGVTEVDGAGVQLLLALRRSLAARERALQLVGPSGALDSACRRLGLADLIDAGDPA